MKRIPRELARKFAFDWRDEPSAYGSSRARSFEVETFDASNGYIRTEHDKAIPARRPGLRPGPAAGQPDRRADLGRRSPAGRCSGRRDRRYHGGRSTPGSRSARRRGPLGESTRWPELSSEYTTKIFRHTPGPSGTTRDGTLHFDESRSWPITPFVGTLGVAPDREVTTSIDGQGEWGGNLDIRDVAPGNRIILPIFHEGARFYLGDVHASQGDTEFTGTAAETKATVRLRLELKRANASPACGSRSRAA